MKYILTFLIALLGIGNAWAQTDVRLQISHQLGGSSFQYNATAANNNNVQFQIERLQYYISQIVLTHDGGQQTPVSNTWLLVNGDTPVDELLGNFNISSLESISFGVGVEGDVNHLDPAQYPTGHPLAPQLPSMHWGWVGGYRFAVLEGVAGTDFNQTWEIHAIEDKVYFSTSVSTAGISAGNELIISLDADYIEALHDIDVSTGLINHGSAGEAFDLVSNFRDRVFSASPAVSATAATEQSINLEIGPNPAFGQQAIAIRGDFPKGAELILSDLSGKQLQRVPTGTGHLSILPPQAGCYLLSVHHEGRLLATEKLLVLE